MVLGGFELQVREIWELILVYQKSGKIVKFKINWRGKEYGIEIAKDRITLKPLSSIRQPLSVEIYGKEYLLYPNQVLKVTYQERNI